MRPRVVVGLAVALLLAALPGCAVHGLAFTQDKRLEFTAPESRAKVRLPITVRWKTTDFEVTGPTGAPRSDAGYFAVFVDRSPQPPNQPLAWFARNDRTCRQEPDCPDEQYLGDRDVYTTTDTEFTIQNLRPPDLGSKEREFHEVTVALLDGTGRRIGETGYFIEFQVVRDRS